MHHIETSAAYFARQMQHELWVQASSLGNLNDANTCTFEFVHEERGVTEVQHRGFKAISVQLRGDVDYLALRSADFHLVGQQQEPGLACSWQRVHVEIGSGKRAMQFASLDGNVEVMFDLLARANCHSLRSLRADEHLLYAIGEVLRIARLREES